MKYTTITVRVKSGGYATGFFLTEDLTDEHHVYLLGKEAYESSSVAFSIGDFLKVVACSNGNVLVILDRTSNLTEREIDREYRKIKR